MRAALASLTLGVLVALAGTARAEDVTLWHAYRGAERDALSVVVDRWNASHPDTQIRPLEVPFQVFPDKLTQAIPNGNGPDVFIIAHERLGAWAQAGIVVPLEAGLRARVGGQYFGPTLEAFVHAGRLYGLPLAYKSVLLFYDPDAIATPPQTTDELLAIARRFSDPKAGKYGLGLHATNFYVTAAFFFGFGGGIFDERGEIHLDVPGNVAGMTFLQSLVRTERVVPDEANGALVTKLYNEGRAPMVVSGPWFAGEITAGRKYAVAPLPTVSATGKPMAPLLTVEGAFLGARSKNPAGAAQVIEYLAGAESALVRAKQGKQPVASRAAYDDPALSGDAYLSAFRAQMERSVPMPNDPRMRAVWEPMEKGLRRVMRGAYTPAHALGVAQRELEIALRPAPAPSPKLPYLLLFGALGLGGAFVLGRRIGRARVEIRKQRTAYGYIAPALVTLTVLVFAPFVVGASVSLFSHVHGDFTFVGLSNFWAILTSRDYGIGEPGSFYLALGVTVLWTVCNLVLHVALGGALAMLLHQKWLRGRGVYRVLLIIPWAIPNYITALIWKGMFHRQFGAVNALLTALGAEPVSWFSQFSTAFGANLCTNTWLGFPFMMVVTLGALTAIPQDLLDAAEVDGATRWQRFRHVTWPLLRPALVPAVAVSSVWTFNMFNIIYLVSGGEPDGATEILITEAYRWAFSRQEQYGYAAAYAVLIFGVLLLYTRASDRVLGRKAEA